jgi:hypothetical protein
VWLRSRSQEYNNFYNFIDSLEIKYKEYNIDELQKFQAYAVKENGEKDFYRFNIDHWELIPKL